MNKINEVEKCIFVFFPEISQLLSLWELFTIHLDSQLKAIGVQVIPVLHASRNNVPVCSIDNSILGINWNVQIII